jgi:ubiquinone/menaquinone biosynthesis C-methylase UbiE
VYYHPNDRPELERESRQFQILHSMMGNRLHLAPLSRDNPPEVILDVGTGIGDWAIAMGDEFPVSRIFGVDISPHQPELVPPNVHFLIQDM